MDALFLRPQHCIVPQTILMIFKKQGLKFGDAHGACLLSVSPWLPEICPAIVGIFFFSLATE
jgi:hypothetical protein